jgi:hypothetical protein
VDVDGGRFVVGERVTADDDAVPEYRSWLERPSGATAHPASTHEKVAKGAAASSIAHHRARRLIAAGLLVTATGCSIAVGRVPMLSTHTVTAADLVRPRMLTHTTRGRSCTWIAFLVPVDPAKVGDAIDDALASTSAAALWDVRISYELLYLPPVVGRGCYVVEGRVP